MNEIFELPVLFGNEAFNFPAQFLRAGYGYKIQVEVYGSFINFEADEERNWRALVQEDQVIPNRKITVELLKAIAAALEDITK